MLTGRIIFIHSGLRKTAASAIHEFKHPAWSFGGVQAATSTQHTGIGQQAVALISSHIIDAGALVQAGVGSTFIDVSLAVRPCSGGI